jgi:monoamine oxidase
MEEISPTNLSLRVHLGHEVVQATFPSDYLPGPEDLLSAVHVKEEPEEDAERPKRRIGIIGAGTAGLCAGLILQKLGYDFDILEASPCDEPNRLPGIGGRVFTYKFSDADWDYYDVGAMRFPYIQGMYPTFDLIHYVGLQDKLAPYIFKSKNTTVNYNDIPYRPDPTISQTTDIFEVGVKAGGTVPEVIATQDAGDFMANNIYKEYVNAFKKGFTAGWKCLKPWDVYSVRAYLATSKSPIPKEPLLNLQAAITWLETNNFGTNMFNDSFVEAVMDYLEFGAKNPHIDPTPLHDGIIPPLPEPSKPANSQGYWPPTPGNWYLLLGGTQSLPEAMFAKIDHSVNRVLPGHRVTGITYNHPALGKRPNMTVSIDGKPPRTYSHVISTISLGCLQTVDLKHAYLSYEQKAAIRTCNYCDSTKVGIKFKSRWWETDVNPAGPVRGGQSYTDRPTRTVVYPSYGIDSGGKAVMIASYNWCQDASRFGSLIKGHDSLEEKQLIDIILRDIAVLHGVEYEWLKEKQYEDHFAWNWNQYEYTRGAFAFFGPGQFTEQFPFVSRPAGKGFLHFAGEATSVHHAWIAGALASAWRAVAEILMVDKHFKNPEEAIKYMNTHLWKQEKLMRQPEEVDMELYAKQLVLGMNPDPNFETQSQIKSRAVG